MHKLTIILGVNGAFPASEAPAAGLPDIWS